MAKEASLLARMARLFGDRAGMYCVSALIAGVLAFVLLKVTLLRTMTAHLAYQSGAWDSRALIQDLSPLEKVTVFCGLLFGLWTPILIEARAVCRITADQLAGKSLSWAQLLGDMIKFIPAALVYTVIIGFSTMIGSSLLFFPGLLIFSLFALVVPASAGEQSGIFAALGRGVSLGLKVFGKTLLLVVASCALIIVIIVARAAGLDRWISGAPATVLAIRLMLIYIPGLLVLVLANICFTLLYLDVRGAELPSSS